MTNQKHQTTGGI